MPEPTSPSDRPLVFATRRLPGDALERLAGVVTLDVWEEDLPPSPSELRRRAEHAHGLITMPADLVDEDLLRGCSALRVVANMAVGYDNLDIAALSRHAIPAGNTPGVLTEATADLAFGLVISSARRFAEAHALIATGQWKTWDPSGLLGLELNGATLGIVGMGRIGEAVARRAQAFGMRTLAWSRTVRAIPQVTFVSFDELLVSSDVITVHVALNGQTRGLIGEREFALMKPTALFVNTSRGAVVNQSALVEALRARRIAGAGLDVFEVEPIGPDDPLLSLDNCVTMPHIGSATAKARSAMAHLVIDNVLAGLFGERLPHCINPQVYESSGPGER